MSITVRALPELQSVLLAWAALFVLYFLLKKLLYKPVSTFLQERKDKIQADLDGVKAIKDEAISLRDEYETRISDAKKESQEIVERARKRGEELRDDIVAEARKEAEAILTKARKEISREKEMALQGIKTQAGELAILIASKIMEEKVNMDNQKNLIDKFIDEVGNSKWQN